MRLLNKNTARRAAAAAALLTMTAAMSVGAFAADAEDATVAGYLPPQSSERSWFRATLPSTLTFRWGR